MKPAHAKTQMVEGHTSSIGALFQPMMRFSSVQALRYLVRKQLRSADFSSQWVRLADGRKVHFYDSPGNRDQPVLVVLPGATMSAASTAARCVPIVKGLVGRRVVVMELPHHGEHAAHPMDFTRHPWDQASIAQDVTSFVDALGINKPHDVLGFSFGGGVASLYLATQPGNLRRAALLAPYLPELAHDAFADVLRAGDWHRMHGWETRTDMQQFFERWLGMTRRNSPGRFLLNGICHHRMLSYASGHFAEFFDTVARRDLGDVGLLEEHAAAMREARVPTLLVYGTHDHVCAADKMPLLANALGAAHCTTKAVASGHSFAEKRGRGIFYVAAPSICDFLGTTQTPVQRTSR